MKRRNFLKRYSSARHKTASTRFKNPYFSKKKTGNHIYLKPIITGLCVIVIVVIVLYLFFILPFFRIQKIISNGQVTITQNNLIEDVYELIHGQRFLFIPNDHILFIEKKKIEQHLLENFDISNVIISITDRTINIEIIERIQPVIWVSGTRHFFLDQNGYIVRELTLSEMFDVQERVYNGATQTEFIQSPIILLFDKSIAEINPGEKVLTKSSLKTYRDVFWGINELTIIPKDYVIDAPKSSWATLQIKHGFDIYINGEGDAQEQINNLSVILNEYKQAIPTIEYIDLRFGYRVYVK